MERIARRRRSRDAAHVDAGQLASSIEQSVRERTGRRIHNLRVEIDTQGVRLQGRCGSFYSKQLAQQAAMDLALDVALTNEIEVA
jgi:osmotically-inducible protein OsmY